MGETFWIVIAVIAYLLFTYRVNIIHFFRMNKMRQYWNTLSKKDQVELLRVMVNSDLHDIRWDGKDSNEGWKRYVSLQAAFDHSGEYSNPDFLKIAIAKAKSKRKKQAKADQDKFEDEQILMAKRRKKLINKYGEKDADAIIKNEVWQGMNIEMLNESLGNPMQKKSQVNKSKQKDQFFYNPRRTRMKTNKPTFRVDLEDGQVTGWKDLD